MADPRFYRRAGPFSLSELAAISGSTLAAGAPASASIRDVGAPSNAETGMIVYASRAKAALPLIGKSDIAVILRPEHARKELPPGQLYNPDPQRAFALIAAAFYPDEIQSRFGDHAGVDPSARLGKDVRVGAGAVIGPDVEIGEGSMIGPNAVIGPGVLIGRHSRIGANATIAYSIIGDHVIVHPGSAFGQDGFGYVASAKGHLKVPQLGRVIVQDNVEIGALTAIDRGALGDTIIGEGTKIDNLVQIAHNCHIGRHVLITAQVGFSGSVTVGDFAAFGGQAGIADHLSIGAGARIGAKSGIMSDVPAGATYAGFPARPRMQWLREVAWVAQNVKNKGGKPGAGGKDDE